MRGWANRFGTFSSRLFEFRAYPRGCHFYAYMRRDSRKALPQVSLESDPARPWEARCDLLASEAGDWHFVFELDNDGGAHLRFGDGKLGVQSRFHVPHLPSYLRTGQHVLPRAQRDAG